MANFTTTQKDFLARLTSRTRAIYEETFKIRNKDYTDFEPPEVARARAENKRLHDKVQEHDNILAGIKRGIMQMVKGNGWDK